MVNFLTQAMTSHGYLALIILAFLQACCIPISSEVVFAFSGVIASGAIVSPHKFSVVAVIVIGTLAEMGGSLTSYAIGRRGGRTLLERYGKWVLVSRSDLDRAERFFAGRGAWTVAVARMLPFVRCFASFGAGVVEIAAVPFTIFSFIGTAIWATALTLLGYNLGQEVTRLYNRFTLVGIALAVLFVAALIAHRVHAIRKDARHGSMPAPHADAPTDRVGSGRSGGAHRAGRRPAG